MKKDISKSHQGHFSYLVLSISIPTNLSSFNTYSSGMFEVIQKQIFSGEKFDFFKQIFFLTKFVSFRGICSITSRIKSFSFNLIAIKRAFPKSLFVLKTFLIESGVMSNSSSKGSKSILKSSEQTNKPSVVVATKSLPVGENWRQVTFTSGLKALDDRSPLRAPGNLKTGMKFQKIRLLSSLK